VADALDARRVADRLGIPLYAIDLAADFGRIIDYFAAEYGRGRTPNPCVRCNAWLKFGRLFEHADAVGATHVATGHYARLDLDAGMPMLRRGLEAARDQSYVLFDVRPDRLRRMLLPVGGLAKADVRRRAAALGLATADKPDSQEICFVAPGEHAALVARRLGGSRAGEIVDVTGRVLGWHPGIEHFTVGQRQGLGIAACTPLFVIRIEADTCRVVVGPRTAVPEADLTAGAVTWLVDPPAAAFACLVQCRAQRAAAPALVTPLPGGGLLRRRPPARRRLDRGLIRRGGPPPAGMSKSLESRGRRFTSRTFVDRSETAARSRAAGSSCRGVSGSAAGFVPGW
jgi:tRNA-specific 2-thiouridylase